MVSMQLVRKWLIFFAMVGYSAGYSSFYVFHAFLVVWVFLAIGKNSIQVSGLSIRKVHAAAFFFLFYCAVTVFWIDDLTIWSRYLFYYVCGISVLLAVEQACRDENEFYQIFKLCAAVSVFNLAIGVLESTGYFRFPTSPYSPYVSLFGRSPSDLSELSDFSFSIVSRKPTGLNWNPNNFGFFVVLCFPFFLLRSRRFAFFSSLVFFWLAFSIGSKGMFVSGIIALALAPIYKNQRISSVIAGWVIALLCAAIFLMFFDSLSQFYGAGRVLASFDEISRGLSFLSEGGTSEAGSTAVRANIYHYVWMEFLSTHGLGLGLGGSEAHLVKSGSEITSLHFFFLQILYDFGMVVFTILMVLYCRLILKTYKASKRFGVDRFSYFSGAISLSLVCAIPASISPSGIHYMLPFYALIGLAISICTIAEEKGV